MTNYSVRIFVFILVIIQSTYSFSQVRFPDVYCNGTKVLGDTIESYFIPLLYEFKFGEGDTTYLIKEGVLKFQGNTYHAPFVFHSNVAYTNFYSIGKAVEVSINQVEVWYKSKLIKVDSVDFNKVINLKHINEIKKNELISFNKNPGKIFIDNKLFNESKVLSLNKKHKIRVSILNSYGNEVPVKYLDLILVRGSRPVASDQIKSDSGEFGDRFINSGKKGDFIIIKVVGKDEVLFNKILFVK